MSPNLATKRAARVALIISSVLLILGYGWLNRVSILRGMADLWVVSDPVEDADAVVVLGGGLDTRPFAAADLYNAGTVKFVLLTVTTLDTELNRTILIKNGVQRQAIIDVGHNLISTYEESGAVVEWAQRTGAKKIIIVTEMFPSRRVRWIFVRQLATLGIKTILYPVRDPGYEFEYWWQNAPAIVTFGMEVIKYFYYRLRY